MSFAALVVGALLAPRGDTSSLLVRRQKKYDGDDLCSRACLVGVEFTGTRPGPVFGAGSLPCRASRFREFRPGRGWVSPVALLIV